MIKEEEKRFREVESQLDMLLHRDEAIIAARGIVITDWSARTYHYKNDYLSWCFRFDTKRARGSEIEKVWVLVSLDEADVTALRVWRRAEIFQIGQLSRWQSTTEELLSLETAIRDGLSSIIFEAIRSGKAACADVA